MAIITKRQVLIILIFKLCLPTFDVYSDVGTAYELFTLDTRPTSRKNLFTALGSCTILFMVLGLIFTIPHYLRNERTWKRRLITLPFLLALCWPQFKAVEVLWIAFVLKDADLFEQRMFSMELEISQVGKY